MAKPFLSVIIPTQDDSRRLPLTLIDLDRHLSEQDYSYEILVVDDGSKDGAPEMLRRFSGLIKHLKVLQNPDRRGLGAVIREGLLAARGSWRLLHPASNSISIVEFNKALPYLKEGYEALAAKGDPLSFFKCFSAEAAEKLAPRLKERGASSLAELTMLMRRGGIKMREVAIPRQRRASLKDALRLLWYTLKIRWRLRAS